MIEFMNCVYAGFAMKYASIPSFGLVRFVNALPRMLRALMCEFIDL
jgi:hypothetical protein